MMQSLLLALKDIFNRLFEYFGNLEGKRKRWIVSSGFNRIHALPRDPEPFCEVLLAPVAFCAQDLEAVPHVQS